MQIDMRALVISDIHANLQALEAVLAVAPPYDAVWNLGDLVGCGPNPNEVVDLARKLGGIVVRGNHDRACSGIMHFSEFRDLSLPAADAAHWTLGVLTMENTQWLAQLRRGPAWPILRKVQCVHGAPRNEDEYLFFKEDARGAIERSRARIIFCGHTHWQVGWSLFRGELTPLKPEYQSSTSAEQFDLPLQKGRRYLLNPGSVGQPRDGDSRAAFAVYDDTKAYLPGTGCPIRCLLRKRGFGGRTTRDSCDAIGGRKVKTTKDGYLGSR
jgi:predicted phosphodiesterase